MRINSFADGTISTSTSMSELDVEWDDPDCDAKGITEHSCMEMQHTRCSSSSSRKSSFFFVFLFLCAPIGVRPTATLAKIKRHTADG